VALIRGKPTEDRGADMTTDPAERSVLLIGKSQLVLDESVAGLRDLGYKADATNDFTDITGRFDEGDRPGRLRRTSPPGPQG
jgi:hypothetical protein